MKRSFFYPALGLLLGQSIIAQAPANYNADNESFGNQPMLQYAFQQLNSKTAKKFDETNIRGSRFYRRGFLEGSIYSKDGLEGKNLMRYDGYNDEVQIKISPSDTTIVMLTQNKDIYCVLGREKIVYREYFDKDGEAIYGHLFKLAETDDLALFERRIKKYKEGKAATTSFEVPVASRFVLQTELYYLDKKDNKIQFFKPSKKNLVAMFETDDKTKNDKLKKFISSSRLNYKDTKDIVQVLYYYNNL
ncbi:hypothetical protein LV716_11760 [Flagellimonas sp. HMM57]|uniref:hypothetical protein n=1 Tax=unclassified Flagellimonas TaxID=2644544 RepID=UPI0013D43AD2|nr:MULTISPECIES: hypothetical protein [unclassified Flagellimonas]MBS9461731.1 hypothetical protein [Flagellimonas sp. 389]UII74932.1 hypothetical protein LV716_11760 [Flagellimonas sp. HMM57]